MGTLASKPARASVALIGRVFATPVTVAFGEAILPKLIDSEYSDATMAGAAESDRSTRVVRLSWIRAAGTGWSA